jgi:rare lipoprotein A
MTALVKRGQLLLLGAALALVVAVSTDGIAVAQPLDEEGTATFYSNRLEGKKTASGEAYDKKALTAAHPKYAYGTKLRVTNLENGKSAVVTVNDRMKRTAQGVIEVTPEWPASSALPRRCGTRPGRSCEMRLVGRVRPWSHRLHLYHQVAPLCRVDCHRYVVTRSKGGRVERPAHV